MQARYVVLLTLLFTGTAFGQTLQDAFPSLVAFDGPTDLQAPDDGSNRLFVSEQQGLIYVFDNDDAATSASTYLDITDRIRFTSSLGLLGFVFDPSYAQNGYVYVHYSRDHPDMGDPDPTQSVIARFTVSSGNPDLADASSEEILITVDRPQNQHNGGQLQFGPDGYLYVSMGDGGGQGDPFNNGQDTTNMSSTLLRLDVRGTGNPLDCGAGTGSATIPADNPLIDGAGGTCDEIYAYGFRNPFRFSFGPDGRIWLADVGQNTREEINLIEPGTNHGWKTWEGTFCFNPGPGGCTTPGFEFPILEYDHVFTDEGGFAVIGGYVYTGNNCAALRDEFVYADFVTGNIWALTYDGMTADNDLLLGLTGKAITTFGRDEQGDVYLVDAIDGSISSFDCDPPVTVSVAPVGAPITVPSTGGAVAFDVTLTNTTGSPQTFDAWADADLSNGAEFGVIPPTTVTLPGGFSFTRRINLNVPGAAPAGTSTLVVKLGDFPDAASSADQFTVTKLTAAGAQQASATWQVKGWDFAEGEAASRTATAAPSATLRAYPSPFTSQATVAYTLPQAASVQLTVYDVLGREVAVLMNGEAETGRHEAVFAGTDLPAGVYLVRLVVGGQTQTQRVTLLR